MKHDNSWYILYMNPCIEYIYIKNDNTMIIVMLFKLFLILSARFRHLGNCSALHDTMRMLAPPDPPHPQCGYQAEARGRPVLARLPGPGTAASASGESTNHSEAARLAEPGAGRGEVTAWSGTGGWRLCSTAAQVPGNYRGQCPAPGHLSPAP